jgi:hypothetical protein
MNNKGRNRQVLSNHAKKIRSKPPRRHAVKQMKASFVPSSEREQNKFLESMSPEYKYEDSGNTDNNDNQISRLLDEKTIQDLTSKHLLDSQQRAAVDLTKKMKPVGNRPDRESLEQLNTLLQNTLPEYQYDRAERGRSREILCPLRLYYFIEQDEFILENASYTLNNLI